ncbi:MAG: glycosyltransferase family 4 protein, partial [Candidatus Kerfeldbacteria bacterium]|nr:glycosyltransferase family 4 protein [Candidatus Kerfeldbacteria bacterium]
MRIGIDCRTILSPGKGEQAGVGHYTTYLVRNLLALDTKNEYVLFFDYRVTSIKEFERPNVRIQYFPFSQYKRYLPIAYSHMLISAYLARYKLDVYHSPANPIALLYGGPSVLTVHDLAIYHNPDWFPGYQKFSTRVLVPRSIRKARRIIAVSEFTRNDVSKIFRVPKRKIVVIPEGVIRERSQFSGERIRRRYHLKKRYALFVGTIEPRKNLTKLVEAFKFFLTDKANTHPDDFQLVLAGAQGWKQEHVFKYIKSLRMSRSVRYLGYVPHAHKIALIKHAACFVFPSLYEGFGLPVLEAMSQGVPVITSDVSSLPEVVGNGAVLMDPRKTTDMTQALKAVLLNPSYATGVAKLGLERSKQFSWRKAAEQTLG